MTSGNFNLSGEKFENYTSNAFAKLYSDMDFTDVTLACDGGKQLKAHKSILSSCSPFFKSILATNPHQHPLIYMRGISYKTITAIIKFIYMGQAEISQDIFKEFVCVAQEFEIEGFSEDILQTNFDKGKKDDTKSKSKAEYVDDNFVSNDHDLLETDPGEDEVHINVQMVDDDLFKSIIIKNEEIDDGNVSMEENINPNKLSDGTFTNTSGDRFQCKQCEKHFSHRSPLYRHVKTVHEVIRFKCNLCDQELKRKSNLDAHIKSKHN